MESVIYIALAIVCLPIWAVVIAERIAIYYVWREFDCHYRTDHRFRGLHGWVVAMLRGRNL
ncbi:hypothetical protein SAMN05216428_102364 [Nitrosospira sp. Nsp11]|nr:hypothetical protein SAMN05216428_102364 [Nitrosospira sp. Nsp11]